LLNALKRTSNSQELVCFDLEIAVFEIEPSWRPSSPSAGLFRSVDTRLNSSELLLVLYTREVTHHTGDKLTHWSVVETRA